MKKHTLFLLLVMAVNLSACGAGMRLPQFPLQTAPPARPTVTLTVEIPPKPTGPGGYPAGVLRAMDDLAGRLKVPFDQIGVSKITTVDWPDSCLGLPAAGEMCAQMITPGFDVSLVVGTAQYHYHTDEGGYNIRLVGEPALAVSGEQSRTLFEWTGPGCEVFSVSTQAAFWGKCGESLRAVAGFNPSVEPFKDWVMSFAAFEAETPAGKVKFTGLGPNATEPADQRMFAEWAKLQFEAAQSGRTGAAWGLVFAYHREGGIAGFCDDVGVYLDGRVLISTCKGLNTSLHLTTSEMQQLYAWYDGYKSVDYSYSDPAITDRMTTTLSMPGSGQKTANEAEIRAMLEFIATLDDRAALTRQAKPEAAAAQQALVDYFEALHGGDFVQGAKLYGGPTDLLQTWNPDIKADLPAWLERGCKQNGLVCLLPRTIRYRGPAEHDGYQFLVEFNLADGKLFTQGPCCGEPAGPGVNSFLFNVLPHGSDWQVMELPPYVP